MELRTKDYWVFVSAKEPQLYWIDRSRGVVLIDEMAVRAKRQEISGLVIPGICINVVEVRPICAADRTAVIELAEDVLA